MKSSHENGMVFITLMAWLMIMTMVMMCCSCASRKEMITEVVTVHDTIQTVRTDTIRDVRLVTVHDSTHHVTERIVTLKESGDTLRIVVNNNVERIVQKSDSLDRYRHVADSLKAVIDKAAYNTHTQVITGQRLSVKYKILFLVSLILAVLNTAVLSKTILKTKTDN